MRIPLIKTKQERPKQRALLQRALSPNCCTELAALQSLYRAVEDAEKEECEKRLHADVSAIINNKDSGAGLDIEILNERNEQ